MCSRVSTRRGWLRRKIKNKKEKEGRRSRRGKWNYVEARWSNVSVSVRDPFFLFFEVCFLRFQRSNRLETGVAESRKIFMIHCNSTTFPFFLFFFKSMYVVIVLYFSKNDSISLRNDVEKTRVNLISAMSILQFRGI